MKNERGITLIALVVTIIALIILAGVSINLVLGNQGIIEKAKLGKEKTENAQEEEKVALQEYENEITEYIVGTRGTGASYKILFDSIASTPKQTYDLTDSIEDYDFIEVYARSYDPGTTTITAKQEQRIMVSDIDYENDAAYAYRISFYYNSDSYMNLAFHFPTDRTFYLYEITQAYSTNTEIYKIVGYKY